MSTVVEINHEGQPLRLTLETLALPPPPPDPLAVERYTWNSQPVTAVPAGAVFTVWGQGFDADTAFTWNRLPMRVNRVADRTQAGVEMPAGIAMGPAPVVAARGFLTASGPLLTLFGPPPPSPVGPRGPLGPGVPLTAAEQQQLAGAVVPGGNSGAALQQAVNLAASGAGGRWVRLKAGEWRLSQTVNVPAGVTLCGEGAGTFLNWTPLNGYCFITRGDGVRYTRFRLGGARQVWNTDQNAYGIYGAGVSDVRLDHLELFGFSYASHFGGEASAQVDHCHIHHNLRTGLGYGVHVASGSWVLIADCEFSHCRHMQASGFPGRTRLGHWEFVHCKASQAREDMSNAAVDAHECWGGTYVVENSLFQDVNYVANFRSGTGLIRGNRIERVPTGGGINGAFRMFGGWVEGTLRQPNGLRFEANQFAEVAQPYAWSNGKNCLIDGIMVEQTRDPNYPPPPPIPRLTTLAEAGTIRAQRAPVFPGDEEEGPLPPSLEG